MAMEGDLKRGLAVVAPDWVKGDRDKVDRTITSYNDMYKSEKGGSVDARKDQYTSLVNNFYDMVTDFYEFGWGHSFHFSPRHFLETFEASTARHEMWLSRELGMKKGKTYVDVGCGIGGPARCIARFSQAHVVGLNNNEYQIKRGNKINEETKMAHLVSFLKADFMHIPVEPATYDGAYQIEATCHAPDKVGIYREILRVLKPGAYFGGYEWAMTNKYDPSNPRHQRIKFGIERGNGLPDLETVDTLLAAMKEAGFEIVAHEDRALDSDIPWYEPLAGSFSIAGFKHTRVGRYLTNRMCAALEALKIAPKGTTEVSNMLMKTAIDLVDGGVDGVFTPMYWILARKPE